MTGTSSLSPTLLPLPLPLPTAPGGRRDWAGLADCAHALGLATLRPSSPAFWLIIVPTVARAEALEAELRFFASGAARARLDQFVAVTQRLGGAGQS